MVRRVFKKTSKSSKLDALIEKYNIPKEFLSINRKTVSRAVAIGVFVALIPMPMQMLLIVFLLPIFRFNAPIGLLMCWLSNPFTMPPIYYIEYLTGNWLLMNENNLDVEMTLEWFESNLGNIFIPLYTGTLFYAVIFSITLYFSINYLWIKSVHKEKHEKRTKRELRK
ncbi:MAG: DUF2062 domain-containing protein [Campylobacterota bacterium]|nr:DUF2062 domain-containing protein [Campylobacterota bacterium]